MPTKRRYWQIEREGNEKEKMGKVIIQCNSFMKVDDFNRLKEDMMKEYKERDVLVLPAYCELKAVLDAEEIEIMEKG